jgi:ATP/maltotriose-dependent transcriptional regulator MalT
MQEVKKLIDKAVTMTDKCCLNCSLLLRCQDILQYKCKNYEKAEADKAELSTRYLMVLETIAQDLKLLELVETGMKIAEKKAQIPIKETTATQEPEQKPALSKRNKEILKLIEQGKSIEEIAKALDIKPETVGVEFEYLVKAGLIKAKPK